MTSNFLAGSINVNPVVVRQLLGLLKEAGLVHISPGVGGAMLTRSPADITLYDVFQAVEDSDKALFRFHDNPNLDCPVGRVVHTVVDERLDDIQAAMRASMEKVTFQELAADAESRIRDLLPEILEIEAAIVEKFKL